MKYHLIARITFFAGAVGQLINLFSNNKSLGIASVALLIIGVLVETKFLFFLSPKDQIEVNQRRISSLEKEFEKRFNNPNVRYYLSDREEKKVLKEKIQHLKEKTETLLTTT